MPEKQIAPESLVERVRRLAEPTMLRAQIVSEVMRLLPGVLEPTERKPTIEELEAILNAEDARPITINPDGSIGQYRPAKVGDIADAVMRLIEPVTGLCKLVEELATALEQVFGRLEDGTLVRNISGDASPTWAISMMQFVREMTEWRAALEKVKAP